MKNLKTGSFVLFDDIPCVVESVQISKAGKHGAAKARVVAKGVFEVARKNVVKPGDSKVEVPIIEKSGAQVIALSEKNVQLMDLQDYSTFEVAKPDFELKEGDEVTIWRYANYVMIKSKK
jgi:translation initiation factor 5A